MIAGIGQSQPLPRLREDLRLVVEEDGPQPRRLVFDALSDRHVELDPLAFAALTLWPLSQTVDELALRLAGSLGRLVSTDEAARLVQFAVSLDLTEPAPMSWAAMKTRAGRGRHGWLMWVVHNYLSFRIPLAKPDKALRRWLPQARLLASKPVLLTIAAIGLIGLYLVSRQFGAFIATMPDMVRFSGIVMFLGALALIKALHECGHAFVAAHFGARVSSMGLAVMLGAPMLYTDVSDAWRLKHRARVWIDAAGILVELAIAVIALFFWAFLPDGTARNLAFALSATSIISSLFLNLNPFMRFDGYYLLADFLNVPNLQPRSFALARWKLREWLFALGEPCPDAVSPALRTGMIAYGFSIWLYRLVVYTGIALMVYHAAFKLLGLALFAIEIIWFIAWPLWQEMKEWHRRRVRLVASRRFRLTAGVAGAVLLMLVTPWSTAVHLPAQLEPAGMNRLLAPQGAEIAALHVTLGQSVKAGEPVITLTSPQLAQERRSADIKLQAVTARLNRRVADAKDRSQWQQLEEERDALTRKLASLSQRQNDLILRAASDGVVMELEPDLTVGRMVARQEPIAVIASPDRWIARGYVEQDDLHRVAPGQGGRFVPDGAGSSAVKVSLTEVGEAAAPMLDIATLASVYGGPIAARQSRDAGLTAETGVYPVTLKAMMAAPAPQVQRGVIVLDGERESLLARFWRRAVRVIIQESGV